MIDLQELLERMDRLLKQYLMASNPERLAFLEAEITAAKEKLLYQLTLGTIGVDSPSLRTVANEVPAHRYDARADGGRGRELSPRQSLHHPPPTYAKSNPCVQGRRRLAL